VDVAERRARYLALFESWLDQALAEEAPPSGIDAGILSQFEAPEPASSPPDLSALFEALTALTQEVKLQGRTFRDLAEAVSPLVPRIDAAAARHDEALDAARTIATEALEASREIESDRVQEVEERCFQESVELLLDLRDRLARGVAAGESLRDEARRRRVGLLGWLRGNGASWTAVDALVQGHRLTLDHVDDVLRARGVSAVECEGRLFEPGRMNAVDLVETDEVPDGVVVEVYRSGYEWNGSVLRPAEVKVARRSRGGER
jgi:molecular chaperone GrpE